MIDSSSGRDWQYSLDSMSCEDLESESIVTVFGGDLVMSSTCSEDLVSESIVTVFGGDLVMSSTCSEDLGSESIVTVFGGDLVMSSTCSAVSMAVSSAVRIGLGDNFRKMEIFTASRHTPALVLPSSRTSICADMAVMLVESGQKFPGLTCQDMGAVILGEAWQVVSDLWGFSFPGRFEGPVLFDCAVPALYADPNLLTLFLAGSDYSMVLVGDRGRVEYRFQFLFSGVWNSG